MPPASLPVFLRAVTAAFLSHVRQAVRGRLSGSDVKSHSSGLLLESLAIHMQMQDRLIGLDVDRMYILFRHRKAAARSNDHLADEFQLAVASPAAVIKPAVKPVCAPRPQSRL